MPISARAPRLLAPLLLAAAIPLLHGCIAALAGGAVIADAAHDRRPIGAVARDRNVQLTAYDAINRNKALVRDDNHVKVVVYNEIMLLAGQVRSAALKQAAEDAVSNIEGTARIVNDIEVTDTPQGFWARRGDDALTARVKAGLLDITSMPGFDPTRVNVTTAHRHVYLMGWVSHEEGDAVAAVASDTPGVEKVVKLYEYTD